MEDSQINNDQTTPKLRMSDDFFYQIRLENLSPEDKAKLMDIFGEEFMQILALEIEKELTDEQKEEVDRLIEQGDQHKVDEYIQMNVSDLPAIFKRVYDQLIKEVRSDVEFGKKVVREEIAKLPNQDQHNQDN